MKLKISKRIVVSSLICLLPIVIGGVLWPVLPAKLVSHIGLAGIDGFLPNTVVVFLLPIVFLAFHLLYCFKPDWLKPSPVNKIWFMPLLSNLFFIFSLILSC